MNINIFNNTWKMNTPYTPTEENETVIKDLSQDLKTEILNIFSFYKSYM